MAEYTLGTSVSAEELLQEERIARLNEARSYLRSSVETISRRVANKLNEEIDRGHDNIAFLCALGLALLKDAYDIWASIAVAQIAAGILASIGSLSALAGAGAGAATGAVAGIGCVAIPIFGQIIGVPICSAIGAVGGFIAGALTAVGGIATGTAISIGVHGTLSFISSLIGLFLSLTLTYFLWGKGWFMQKTWLKLIWWIGTFFFSFLPLVKEAPMETINVLNTWRLVRKRAHKAEKKMKELKKLTKNELEELDNDISRVDEEE